MTQTYTQRQQIDSEFPDRPLNASISLSYTGSEPSIYLKVCESILQQLKTTLKNITDSSTILVVDGNIMGYGTGFLGLLAGDGTLIGMVIPEGFDASLPAGIYAVIIDDKSEGNVANRYYIAGLDYEYANVIVDKRYSSVLKKNGEANVFVVDAGSADVTTVDFSAYQAGDVVLVIGADELAEVSV